MIFYSTPHDDEPARSESQYYDDYLDTMPSLRRHVQTVPPGSPTPAVPQARRFASPSRMRTGNSPNVSTAADTLGFPADTSSSNNLNGYMDLNVPSPYRREAATSTQWQHSTPSFSTHENYAQVNTAVIDYTAQPQNYFSPANSMSYNNGPWPQNAPGYTHPAATSELQYSSGYGDYVHNPPSVHGPRSHNTAEEFWHADAPVAGGNLPPSSSLPMQYPHAYAPYSPQFLPGTDGASSSHPEPYSHRERPSYHEPSSAHNFEAYRGSWPQWHDSAIGDPQPPGLSFPEQPVPSMTPLPLATAFSQPYTSHGGDMGYHSYRPPSTQRHQHHHGSQTQETHHSPSSRFSCAWIVGDNTTCGFEGTLDAFKTHFRSNHLSGAQNAPNRCLWQGCNYRRRDNTTVHVMRRDSAWRHVWETHLGMKRGI